MVEPWPRTGEELEMGPQCHDDVAILLVICFGIWGMWA